MSDKPIYLKKNQSNVSSHVLWWQCVQLFFFFEIIFIIQIFFRKHEIILQTKTTKFVCRAVSHTLVAVTDVAKFVVLEEDPLELAGGVWATTDLLFVLFVPLAALVEWEKVNLKPPEDVLLGRFSLSSLSFAKANVKIWISVNIAKSKHLKRTII